MRMRQDSVCMCLLGRSLGKKGCGVKRVTPFFSCTYILYWSIVWKRGFMAHTSRDKEKLLIRVRRIRGQVEAIERALGGEHECSEVLQLVAACRGALNSLMAELVEGHIWFHVLDPNRSKDSAQAAAAEELIDIVKAYLK